MENRSNKYEGKRTLKEIEEELEEELLDQEDNYAVGFGGDGNGDKKKKGKSSSEMEGSSNNNATSTPMVCCQADNCDADMSEAKRYHKRHKVCEIHAKAPLVLVSGIHQRFCQQCSRFHEVSEFDGNKKSCRSRLAGHNERRRKSSYE